MKNNNSTFIVLGGIFILSVFSFIVAKNILPDSDNNQYYAKPNENIIGYVYVFLRDDDMIKDNDSYQYKCYKSKKPIDIIEVTYRDFKNYYYVKSNSKRR